MTQLMLWQWLYAVLIQCNMSQVVQYMTTHGVPELSLVFFLMLPIAATLLTFARQVLGVKAFGIYIPLITTLAFLATGIKYGVFLFVVIVLVGTLLRFILKRTRLLYLPRMAITLITIIICIYIIFAAAIYFGKNNFVQISVFPVLILITLSEKFIATQIRRGNRAALILTLETLILSIICYFLISWHTLQNFALAYPVIVIGGAIILNIFLGRWTGLRLTEYLRFKEVINQTRLPKK